MDELAHHFGRSDNIEKAVEYLERAGQQALQRSAYADAINGLSAAINLLRKLPDSLERIRREVLLRLAVGPALVAVKGRAARETERAYTHARELSERLGDPPELFSALFGLWAVHLVRGASRRAYELAEHLLRRAQGAHDPVLLLYPRYALGITSYWMGQFLSAQEHFESAINLYDPERDRPLAFRYLGVDAKVTCLSYASLTLWQLGYPDHALQKGDEAIKLAQGLSHPHSLASAEYHVGLVLRHYRREAPRAQEKADRVIAFCVERGFTDFLALATIMRGRAMAEGERNGEGIAQIQEGLDASRATGAELFRPYFLCMLAEVYMDTGRLDNGLSALMEALVLADKHEEREHEAEIYRLKGELLLRRDESNTAEAQNCFERAIEIARRQSAKSLELRATMSLARLLRDTNRPDEACAMLGDIYGWFTEGFDTADLIEAKSLLDELNG